MNKQVHLTQIAETDLEDITDYVLSKWGYNVVIEFIKRFEDMCSTLSYSPELFPVILKEKNIRKAILTKHNSIYFREDQEQIVIITIFDTRQDPVKLKHILKD